MNIQQRLRETAVAMGRLGLSPGSSGNVSVRCEDGFWITPSAMRYGDCVDTDMVLIDSQGRATGKRRPSSEWQLHAVVYRERGDAGAILHAHSPWCSTLACLQRGIPAFHYMVALAGGDDIPCSGYAPFGTEALAELVAPLLRHRRACLMGNHGLICHAGTLDEVLQLAEEVEHLAQVYCQALQIGEPVLLSDVEMQQAVAAFLAYRASND